MTLRDVRKKWSALPHPTLDGVDLDIGPGVVTWIVGRNGVGKTTLLRITCALIQPDAGVVRMGEIDPERDRREFHRRIGFLPAATSGLYARMSPRQHMHYWAGLALVPRKRQPELVAEALERFELAEFADRRSDRLSMGQRQRVRLAMAFLHRPDVMLVDEPLTSLDDEAAELFVDALGAHIAAGGGAMWCAPKVEAAGERLPRIVRTVQDGKLLHS
jgi:ABC-2 type transport system ATP-binding protein